MVLKCTKRSDLKRSAQGKEIVPLLLFLIFFWFWASEERDEGLFGQVMTMTKTFTIASSPAMARRPKAEKLCRSVMSEIDQNGDPPLHTPYTVIKQWPTRVGLSFLQPDPASSSFALFRFQQWQNTFGTFFFRFSWLGFSRWWRCCWDWEICFGWAGFGDGGWVGVFDG